MPRSPENLESMCQRKGSVISLLVLVSSTIVVGYGNFIGGAGSPP